MRSRIDGRCGLSCWVSSAVPKSSSEVSQIHEVLLAAVCLVPTDEMLALGIVEYFHLRKYCYL